MPVSLVALLTAWFTVSNANADSLLAHFFEGGVSRWSSTSGEVMPFIAPGTAGLAGPSGLASDSAGNVYVTSQFTGEVLYFDGITGEPLPSPIDGGRDGLFAALGENAAPGLLRFGPGNNLYVADAGVKNIHVVDSTTGLVTDTVFDGDELASAGLTIGLTFDVGGDILVGKDSPTFQGSILRVDGDTGDVTTVVAEDAGVLSSVNSMLRLPTGELLAVDLFGNQIVQFDNTAGENPQQLANIPPDIPDPLPTGAQFPSNFPVDVAIDRDGTLLVGVLGLTNPFMGGDNRGALLRYAQDGTLLDTLSEGISPVSAILLRGIPGDYNDNGQTEQSDLDLVLLGWGTDVVSLPDSWSHERPTSGIVDQAELDRVLLNWGAGTPPPNGTGTVPEPTTLLMACVAMTILIGYRRKLG